MKEAFIPAYHDGDDVGQVRLNQPINHVRPNDTV